MIISKPLFIVADALVLCAAIAMVVWAIGGSAKSSCGTSGTVHRLSLQSDTLSRAALTVQRCDVLTIRNDDKLTYRFHFGQHDDHLNYAGYTPRLLTPGNSISVTLSQAGSYEFHDHLRDSARVLLTIQ